MTVDLHVHSLASDGTLAPAEVVRQAQACGLSGLALTDHETTAGLAAAAAEAQRLGIDFVPGIEINTDAGEGEFHFLGYFIRPEDPGLQAALARCVEQRWIRARAILARLRAEGIRVEEWSVAAAANGAPVCRPHIAMALVAAGYASTLQEGYQRYLQSRSPFFVPHTGLTAREAVAAIRAAGGVPVLSHPTSLPVDAVLALRPLGLMGLEVNHPEHTPEVAARWREVAHRHGLVATGGSDYHGAESVEPDRELGAFLAPPGAIEALRGAQERLKRGA